MKFTKIVITGGPCAGKTTGLSYIEQKLSQRGYKVIFLNETATELMLNNLNPNMIKNNYAFEKNIVKLQLEKERFYEEACRSLPYEKVILICDRGLMDARAYMSDDEYSRILKDLNLNEIQIRDHDYDAVFHLVTAAKGAEEFYTTANNQARRENLEEAIEADTRTMNAWVGHPHLRAVDNSTDFDIKIKRLFKEICAFLGEPEPFEIERKFLIERPEPNLLVKLANCKKVNILQTYLNSENADTETRVRQRGLDGSYIYTATTKKQVTPMKRIETERRITEREYLTLLTDADTRLHQIRKDRYCIMHDNHYFELDQYPFAKKRAVCEIEMASEDEKFNMPEYIKVIKEVTDDKSYSNHALAEKIPLDLN